MNGFVTEETFTNAAGILPSLQEAIAHFYPDSTYAKSLNDEVRHLTAQRLFRKPRVGMLVQCPHCGASHAASPAMEELIQFICAHYGENVSIEPPRIH